VVLSVYAAVMLIAMVRALGSLLVLRAVVFSDHHLVTTGPFRFLRHPGYSAALALWLGAGLGTMNGPVLILWVVAVAGTMVAARAEDELLREKFGLVYDAWAEDVGEFVPKFGAKRAPVA
jgi:protein-S-isoprenylcysteine O-methyltransferase Ste14